MTTKTTKSTLTVQTTLEISLDRISSLLISAFEGGSNYWYRIEKFVKPREPAPAWADFPECRHAWYPLVKGGALVVSDYHGNEGTKGMTTKVVDLAAIQAGLGLMAKESPRHWSNFINEDDDSETGDVFLQYVVLGEIVYG